MTAEAAVRDPSLTREELQDLLNYLNGLPTEARQTGAFSAYEQRVAELSRELILSDILFVFSRQIGDPGLRGFSVELATRNPPEYGRMREALSLMTERYEHAAERSVRASSMIHWGLVAASAASLLSAMSAASALVVAFSCVSVALALLYVGFAERARRQERTTAYLSTLLEEIAHSFGPSGEVLRLSEYYPANAKRIELLLDEIKASVGHDRAGA